MRMTLDGLSLEILILRKRAGHRAAEIRLCPDNPSIPRPLMRVILLHNPKAGPSEWSDVKLKDLLTKYGHQVTYASTKSSEWEAVLRGPGQVVAIAGGDGTVGLVSLRLSQRELPFCILPLGTANNIAASLGYNQPVEKIVSGIKHAKKKKLDLGTVSSCRGTQPFIEAVGAGILAELMLNPPKVKSKKGNGNGDVPKEIYRARKHLISMVEDYEGFSGEVVRDGKKTKGKFLAVEVMNTDRIGPKLLFAPVADAGDGRLDVVCITVRERAKLVGYLKALLKDDHAPSPFRGRPCRSVELRCPDASLHVNDKGFPGATVEIALQPAALQYLA
jgi:diacylglycerol kinase family enzyme